MDVVVSLGDPVELTVTDVHPIALQDAVDLAVKAGLCDLTHPSAPLSVGR